MTWTSGPASAWAARLPAHSPGELAISREEYRRWLTQMGRMGVHTLRIYTVHPPVMYEELKAYNEAHPRAPIYLVQGVYLPDESYLTAHNLFAPTVTRGHGRRAGRRQQGRAW